MIAHLASPHTSAHPIGRNLVTFDGPGNVTRVADVRKYVVRCDCQALSAVG
jgi:hypothetical protein